MKPGQCRCRHSRLPALELYGCTFGSGIGLGRPPSKFDLVQCRNGVLTKMTILSRRLLALLVATLVSTNAMAGLPVIPGGTSFGIDTSAGRGGKIYRVTNLNATGYGSLYECAAASGARTCVFEVSGVIRLTSDLHIRNPYLTIAGQTAPAPGIMIRGAGLAIRTSNVLVQHISVRPGDDPTGPALDSRDALKFIAPTSGAITNVVIDHCSFSWSTDEVMDLWDASDNITLSNNIFSEPLKESLHPKGSHDYAALLSPNTGRVSFVGNLFAHATDRNPRTAAAQFVFVNNVVYNYGQTGAFLFTKGSGTENSLVGNVFIKGPSSSLQAATIRLDGGETSIVSGTKIFLKDNIGHRPDGTAGTSDPWSLVNNGSGLSRAVLEAMSPPTWPNDLVAQSTANDKVLTNVLANAGSRPAQRSAVDARIVGQVQTRTGRMVNCVANDGTSRCAANAGGWPNYAQNQRALDLPSNPNGDDDGDGYTNIEEWLHEMAADVEGGASVAGESRPKPPVMSVE